MKERLLNNLRRYRALLMVTLAAGLVMNMSACSLIEERAEIEIGETPLLGAEESPDSDTILSHRERWCVVSEEERHQAMENFDQESLAFRFEQLLIASCEPELYPGKLAIAVKSLLQSSTEEPSVRRVVAMIAEFSQSQQIHLNELTKLQKKLDETIEAISDIEEGISQRKEEVKP
ncbi:hypothetical protein [Hahella ganghwensis]|uniref:hypothetical protein n=1 Tax=Hahella ganghwensis TaxID=286420 RepID=UPI00036F7BBB|nr:hypothetical protein [Hahella ganghwensis]